VQHLCWQCITIPQFRSSIAPPHNAKQIFLWGDRLRETNRLSEIRKKLRSNPDTGESPKFGILLSLMLLDRSMAQL
jgi:hypothetical protein